MGPGLASHHLQRDANPRPANAPIEAIRLRSNVTAMAQGKATGLLIGVAIGTVIGMAIENIAMGIGIGIALGVAIGMTKSD